jgi:hypothetical protein
VSGFSSSGWREHAEHFIQPCTSKRHFPWQLPNHVTYQKESQPPTTTGNQTSQLNFQGKLNLVD